MNWRSERWKVHAKIGVSTSNMLRALNQFYQEIDPFRSLPGHIQPAINATAALFKIHAFVISGISAKLRFRHALTVMRMIVSTQFGNKHSSTKISVIKISRRQL